MGVARSAATVGQGTARKTWPASLHNAFQRHARKPHAAAAGGGAQSSYLPGLDGLRALSVIAVLIYHARPGWLPGGFLGVEVFFVISGFIITRALLSEWRNTGHISIRSFWVRRARRLLPAVLLLLAGTLGYSAIFRPDEVATLRGDVLAALAYVMNWHLILGDQSYFDSFSRPSMLRHLWSLAVEEQFYIIWPLVLGFGLSLLKVRGLFLLIVAGIAASAAVMAILYDPAGSPSRVYFGTDTRAAGLLAGSALAFLIGSSKPAGSARWVPPALAAAGVAALGLMLGAAFWLDEGQSFLYRGGFLAVSLVTAVAILAASSVNLFAKTLSLAPLRWVGVRSYGIYLWHWPLYMLVWPNQPTILELVGLVTVTLLISAASYSWLEMPMRRGALSHFAALLRSWPSLGLRYKGALGASGVALASLTVALIGVAAFARQPAVPAYFELESVRLQNSVVTSDVSSVSGGPVMLDRVQTTLASLQSTASTCGKSSAPPEPSPFGLSHPQLIDNCNEAATLFHAPDFPERDAPDEPQSYAAEQEAESRAKDEEYAQLAVTPAPEQEEESLEGDPTPTAETPPSTPDPSTQNSVPQESEPQTQEPLPETQPADPPPEPTAEAPPPEPPAVLESAPSVTAIGDSVMLGAAYTLAGSIPGIDLDAAVGRQAPAAAAILQDRVAAGLIGQVVLIHIGNNGTLTSAQFEEIMQVIGPERQAIFLNVRVPRSWQDSNNLVLAEGVSRHTNARLLDWNAATSHAPGLFNTDGIHLTPSGSAHYTQLIVSALGG